MSSPSCQLIECSCMISVELHLHSLQTTDLGSQIVTETDYLVLTELFLKKS